MVAEVEYSEVVSAYTEEMEEVAKARLAIFEHMQRKEVPAWRIGVLKRQLGELDAVVAEIERRYRRAVPETERAAVRKRIIAEKKKE